MYLVCLFFPIEYSDDVYISRHVIMVAHFLWLASLLQLNSYHALPVVLHGRRCTPVCANLAAMHNIAIEVSFSLCDIEKLIEILWFR